MENKNPYDIPLGEDNRQTQNDNEEFPWEKVFDDQKRKKTENVGDITTKGKIIKPQIDPESINAPLDAISIARGEKTPAEKKRDAQNARMDRLVNVVNNAQEKERRKKAKLKNTPAELPKGKEYEGNKKKREQIVALALAGALVLGAGILAHQLKSEHDMQIAGIATEAYDSGYDAGYKDGLQEGKGYITTIQEEQQQDTSEQDAIILASFRERPNETYNEIWKQMYREQIKPAIAKDAGIEDYTGISIDTEERESEDEELVLYIYDNGDSIDERISSEMKDQIRDYIEKYQNPYIDAVTGGYDVSKEDFQNLYNAYKEGKEQEKEQEIQGNNEEKNASQTVELDDNERGQ